MKTWLMSHAPHRVLLSPDMTQLTFLHCQELGLYLWKVAIVD